MGYFSNGSESMAYEAQYCDRCLHQKSNDNDGGCAVWLAHMLYNYDECNNPNSILHLLIPRSKGGLDNAQCTMFLEDPQWNQEQLPL
jgi:hypothetical protein